MISLKTTRSGVEPSLRNRRRVLSLPFAQGDFYAIFDWLRRNIHKRGSTFPPRTLIREATGSDLDPSLLVSYCQNKYTELYHL